MVTLRNNFEEGDETKNIQHYLKRSRRKDISRW
jgi:hypothetical protein